MCLSPVCNVVRCLRFFRQVFLLSVLIQRVSREFLPIVSGIPSLSKDVFSTLQLDGALQHEKMLFIAVDSVRETVLENCRNSTLMGNEKYSEGN